MGAGIKARDRRVVWQWSFKRYRHDNQVINAMIERAEAVAVGERELRRDRFVTSPAPIRVDRELVKRAQYLAGLKGYVTNIKTDIMDGDRVVAAYRDLYLVTLVSDDQDRPRRPVFHRPRNSIEAHLTIVFAALAVSRKAQAAPAGHQQNRQKPTAVADRHDHPRPPADHRRGPTNPGRPRRRCSLNRCDSGRFHDPTTVRSLSRSRCWA
jgi:hypothetical protein